MKYNNSQRRFGRVFPVVRGWMNQVQKVESSYIERLERVVQGGASFHRIV